MRSRKGGAIAKDAQRGRLKWDGMGFPRLLEDCGGDYNFDGPKHGVDLTERRRPWSIAVGAETDNLWVNLPGETC
jgi:hypothetical protein